MFLSKEILVKGIASVGVAGIAVGGYLGRNHISGYFSSSSTKVSNPLLDKAGIKCEGEKGCVLEGGKELSIRQGSDSTNDKKVTTLSPATSTGAKITIQNLAQKNVDNEGPKFTVTGGDISLGDTSSQVKLEELETYELKEEEVEKTKKYVLVRKTTRDQEIKSGLDLPSEGCEFPTDVNGHKDCTLNLEKLKKIKFKDKSPQDQNITLTNDSLVLKIHKTTDSSFPFGYKFNFQNESEISINSTTPNSPIKLQKNIDFRIKRESNGSMSLEKAWEISKLLEKVGLSGCESAGAEGADCSIKENKLNVSHGSDKKVTDKNKTTTGSNGGKIRLYTQSSDHSHNLKFVIEEGDISIGSSSDAVTKLEQFETYEIKEDGDKHYLTRKKKSWEEKRRLLGLPEEDGCAFPEGNTNSKDCSLDETKLKKVNFDGKSGDITITNGAAGTSTLKISVTSTDEKDKFPLGYKFTLTSNKDINLGNSKSIKKDTNTEFKIKKSGTGKNISLSLEKAWTITEFGKKVGLNCPAVGAGNTEKKCSFTENQINVYNDSTDKIDGAKVKGENPNDKKISYEEDAEGHNQGFKFTTEQDISLEKNGGSASGGDKKINAKGSGNETSYEIKKDTDGKWYLTKKTASR